MMKIAMGFVENHLGRLKTTFEHAVAMENCSKGAECAKIVAEAMNLWENGDQIESRQKVDSLRAVYAQVSYGEPTNVTTRNPMTKETVQFTIHGLLNTMPASVAEKSQEERRKAVWKTPQN